MHMMHQSWQIVSWYECTIDSQMAVLIFVYKSVTLGRQYWILFFLFNIKKACQFKEPEYVRSLKFLNFHQTCFIYLHVAGQSGNGENIEYWNFYIIMLYQTLAHNLRNVSFSMLDVIPSFEMFTLVC